MTLGQYAEIAVTKRPPSTIPAKAVEEVTHVKLDSAAYEVRASTPIYFAYGTVLGGALAVLNDISKPARTATIFALAWSGGAALPTSLELAPLPNEQKPAAVVTDLGHHLV